MKLFILFLLAVASLQADAQNRYCKSYEDYKSDIWVDLPSLNIKHNSYSKQLWGGTFEYDISTGDRSTDKKLRKEALFIYQRDSMYVNLRNIRCDKIRFGSGLAYGIPLIGKKILFISRRVSKKSFNKEMYSQILFGLVGNLNATASNIKNNACYILDTNPNGKYTDVMIVDDEVMKKLIVDDRELLNKYFMVENRNERETPSNIIPLLKEKGLIE